LELPVVAETAAVTPSAGRSLADRQCLVQHRVAALEDLYRLQRAVTVRDAQRVVAVLRGAPAPAATLVREVGEDVARLWVHTTDGHERGRASVVGRDPVGERVRQRSVDGHDEMRMDLRVPADARPRILDVHDRPG